MKREQINNVLKPHLPENSISEVVSLIIEHQVYLKITKSRSSKYGDFRVPGMDQQPKLSINHNLNPYAFLITLLHEMAHLVVWKNYKSIYKRIKPHGMEWKKEFKNLMKPFLRPDIFPEPLLSILKKHMLNAKASSSSDIRLMKELRKFDKINEEVKIVADFSVGETFILRNNPFRIIKKNRSRYLCENTNNQKKYLIHSLAEVKSHE